MQAFTARELVRPGTLARLFNRQPKTNAFVEIENLLATREPQTISDIEVDQVLQKYKCKEADYTQSFADLYRKAVAFCAADESFSDNEKADLDSLKRVLKIGEQAAIEIKLSIVVPIFERLLREAIKGLKVREQNDKLISVAQNLSISDETLGAIVTEQARTVFSEEFCDAIKDNRLSPEEESKLSEVLAQFTVKGSSDVLDDATRLNGPTSKTCGIFLAEISAISLYRSA